MIAYLDTHAVVVMRTRPSSALGRGARKALQRAQQLRISPIVLLELQLLKELGRLNAGPESFVAPLQDSIGLMVCDLKLERVVSEATALSWTRDPFDRLIVAQALANKGQLITKDDIIHQNCAFAVWN